MPRRAPDPDSRLRDAERTRRRLLDAAFDEFAARGYAGARVQDIAARAGVNKQLITYYFGGKEGLYTALRESWHDWEAAEAGPEVPLTEAIARYAGHALEDPRAARLILWHGLAESDADTPDATADLGDDVEKMRARRERGEFPAELDPGVFQLVLMAISVAPVALRDAARVLTGLDAASPEFAALYLDQIRRIVGRIAETHPDQTKESP
ncbi:TetR family transcriptional regulator [Actinorhabdospora filicis]|uniref:TetR family transcriptional regulator n=1 Tax=Actinorhabdospora filicis TaxID=1785913 RepID=A0A9W6SGN8_9ACTN|nr:TetR family transcriptional regulator [Actinorhabdospora filicis]GLZ75527.1 TetR family transcriptional regulator [Actinorhabdospora filicis]